MSRLMLLAIVSVAACGGGAAKAADAPLQTTIESVDCSTVTPNATVTLSDAVLMYMPQATSITMGQVVKFQTSSMHDVTPDSGTDPGIHVDFATTKCLRFTFSGDYTFHCSMHGFTGSVTVM